ncbi:MAG: ferritin [Halocynthiibacter sp.]
MKLKSSIEDALNAQINMEMQASYAYLAMSNYFAARDLPGFATWYREQSTEETVHAMKIHDYILKRGGEVRFSALTAPRHSFQSVEDVVGSSLSQEEGVSESIQAIYQLANTEHDAGTQSLMTWFIDEQEEEEESFQELLAQVKAAAEDPWRLLLLDKELPSREAAPAE